MKKMPINKTKRTIDPFNLQHINCCLSRSRSHTHSCWRYSRFKQSHSFHWWDKSSNLSGRA